MWLLLGLVGLVVFLGYWYLKNNNEYWRKKGVPSPPASLFFGHMGPTLTMAKSAGDIFTEIYKDYPELNYVGFYKIRQPALVIRDPSLVMTILTKEFQTFHDNDIVIDEKVDPIASKNTFTAKGENWKVLKNQISPCFTPKKLKAMYPLLEEAAKKCVAYLETAPEATDKDGVESKEVCAKYSTDVVASCAFGLEANSFTDPDSDFRRFGKKIFQPSASIIVKFLLLSVFPGLIKILKVKFFEDDIVAYFRNIINQTLKYRKENNVVRHDFLDYMMELKGKLSQNEFSDDHILGHAMGFFTDGFETSSAVINYIFYELGSNPDVQEKLLEEIQTTYEKNRGKIDYDTLHSLPYLDAIMLEALRMHNPGTALLRVNNKPFTLPPPRGIGSDVHIEAGTPVMIPLYGIHYDAKYFPEPDRFNPERFIGENKNSIPRGAFLPFGEGPRGCHGQRFGVMQTKTAVFHVVRNFEIKVNSKTKEPLEWDPAHLIVYPKGGIWLNFHKR